MQIQLNNRFIDNNGSRCKLSVDGTDFMVYEPRPFDRKWYSEKFHGAGLRYEIGVCIQTGWICWVNGPFPCGSWPDIQISRDSLVYELLPDEFVLADRGYGGVYHLIPNNTGHNNQQEKRWWEQPEQDVNQSTDSLRCMDALNKNGGTSCTDKAPQSFLGSCEYHPVENHKGASKLESKIPGKMVVSI